MQASFLQRHSLLRDVLNILVFIVCVLVGTLLINSFVFRSFNVIGPSMEDTLHTGDRLIVNRLPVTWQQVQNKTYIPERGQVIVFKNPMYNAGTGDEFIVKRVIAFPGERVTVQDGVLTVYNDSHPEGFNPDDDITDAEISDFTSGSVDTTVAADSLFVAGDHRVGDFSYDSRNGLGLIPYYDVIGPVSLRIWPVPDFKTF